MKDCHSTIKGEVVITNSVEAIVNNSIALLIVFFSKILREFDAVVEVVDVHTTRTLYRAHYSLPTSTIGPSMSQNSIR
jgi:hypothetical protein